MNALIICILCGLAVTALGESSINAYIDDFPWQGSLQVRNDSSWVHTCGCVLYSKNKALTAAHCLDHSVGHYRVVFGMQRLYNIDGTDQSASVTKYVKHPSYTENERYSNDIAVMHFSPAVETSGSAVGTIPLASGRANYAGRTCTATGWRRLSGGRRTPGTLQKMDMTVLINQDCANRWSGISGAYINEGHVCTLGQGGAASSLHDGGPLVCNSTLVGIKSWYTSPFSGNYPNVYTRIPHFNNWIRKQLL